MKQKLSLCLLALLALVAAARESRAGTPPAAGESCVSGDSHKICLAIHFVSYLNPNGQPMVSTDQAGKIIHTMNQIWNTCGIGFQIEKYETADPSAKNLPNGVDSQTALDQVRQAFVAPKELLAVTTADWSDVTNAWTNMPGDGLYGAVMESSMARYGDGVIYAHEFGHYLGLDHVSDQTNLMNPVVATDGTKLASDQCQLARDTADSYWAAMERR